MAVHDRFTRRTFGALSIGAAVAATSFRAASAQDASPMASPTADEAGILAGLELTALDLTVTEFTFNLSNPGSLAEGWYVFNVTNESEAVGSANLALLPEGTSAGDLSALKSQAFMGEGGELPAWWSETTFGGGATVAPGETVSTLVYLTPGQWSIFSTNPTSAQSPANFRILTPEELEANYGIVAETSATPEAMPAGVSAPEGVEASMTLGITDSGFNPSGAPASGPQVIEVVNEGEQVHDIVILHSDETVDEATAGSIAESFVRGEETDATVEGGVGTLSPGATAFVELSGDAGTHLVFSTLPDENGGIQLETVGVLVFEA